MILSTTYSALFFLAAVCVATGLFHPDAHAHHEGHPHHRPVDTNAHHPAGTLDLCEFARQALMTTTWRVEPLPLVALLQGDTVKPGVGLIVLAESRVASGIRAPPGTLS